MTHSSATLIDNIYVRKKGVTNIKGSVLLDDVSDHYPCIISIECKNVAQTDRLLKLERSQRTLYTM